MLPKHLSDHPTHADLQQIKAQEQTHHIILSTTCIIAPSPVINKFTPIYRNVNHKNKKQITMNLFIYFITNYCCQNVYLGNPQNQRVIIQLIT